MVAIFSSTSVRLFGKGRSWFLCRFFDSLDVGLSDGSASIEAFGRMASDRLHIVMSIICATSASRICVPMGFDIGTANIDRLN